ncbi:hypothetical protein BKA82DRAFT_4019432 [Pisolithus tinctorius]|nr:hypothetical protein BKA82DRAFT_4019432 [Pisolithus tinctorius]
MGSVANSTPHISSNAAQEAPMVDQRASQYTCRPWTTLCLYTDPEGWECLEPINCGTVPGHFKDKHGITNMAREVGLVCLSGNGLGGQGTFEVQPGWRTYGYYSLRENRALGFAISMPPRTYALHNRFTKDPIKVTWYRRMTSDSMNAGSSDSTRDLSMPAMQPDQP